MEELRRACIRQLETQVLPLLNQLTETEFKTALPILFNSSIGQHTRHILEFFQCLINSQNGVVNYDTRKRNLRLEQDLKYARAALHKICTALESTPAVSTLEYQVGEVTFKIETSLQRELVYMIEHIVHHLAIMRAGLTSNFKHIELPQNFGIAQSTINHYNKARSGLDFQVASAYAR